MILWGVMLFACSGGGGAGGQVAPTPPLENFELRIAKGIFSHDLLIKNKEIYPLALVKVTITTQLEDGTNPKINRFWEEWKLDEVKTINIPARSTLQNHWYGGNRLPAPDRTAC